MPATKSRTAIVSHCQPAPPWAKYGISSAAVPIVLRIIPAVLKTMPSADMLTGGFEMAYRYINVLEWLRRLGVLKTRPRTAET